MPKTKPKKAKDITLSHFRGNVWNSIRGDVRFRAGCERRIGGGWKSLMNVELPRSIDIFDYCDTLEALQEHAEAINRLCKQLLMQDKQQKAEHRAWMMRRKERKRAAQAEYRQYLEQLPLSADGYKESSDRMRYAGDPDGHCEPRPITDWMDLQARKRWPESTASKKQKIREKHDLGAGTSLIY